MTAAPTDGEHRRPSPWPLARRFVEQTPGAKRALTSSLAWALAGAGALIGQIGVIARLVDLIFLGRWTPQMLAPLLLLGAFLTVLRASIEVRQRTESARLAWLLRSELRRQFIGRLFDLGPAYGAGKEAGSLVTALLEAVDALSLFISTYVPQMVLAVAIPFLVLTAVGLESRLAGVILVVTGPLVPLFMVLVGRAAGRTSEGEWRTLLELNGRFLDLVRGLLALRIFGRARPQVTSVLASSERYRTRVMATLRVALLSAFVLELFASLATAVVAVAVGLALVGGRVAFFPALVVLMLTPEFFMPMRQLGSAFHQALSGVTAADSVLAVLDRPLPATVRPARILPKGTPPSIAFEDLAFTYPGRMAPLFEHLSLTVRSGERVALRGESGSGKTTLLLLALAYLHPTSGRVRVSGIPLDQLTPSDWRLRVALVSQSPYLVTGTLRENLMLARPGARDEVIWEALEKAQALGFVRCLPQGLDTPVGDRGQTLSGGEARRIALARVFLRDTPVMLLDEPTVHLDPLTRRLTLQALADHLKGRTVLLATHHEEEAALADRSYEMGHPNRPREVRL